MNRIYTHLFLAVSIISTIFTASITYAQTPLSDPIHVNPGGTWPQYSAFNPERNEYLVVYREGTPRIRYSRLDVNGNRIGAEVTIIDSGLSGCHRGAVAYNSVNDEYLIVYGGWLDVGGGATQDGARAHRVSATTGALIGSPIAVYGPAPGGFFEVDIAYSPTSNVYLATWHQNTPAGAQIWAYRLAGATGAVVGSQILVSNTWTWTYCAVPHVCWNSSANEFEVMYQVSRDDIGNGFDEYGQRIRASDGALLGGAHAIATAGPAWDRDGDIVYDPGMNRYLAVYQALGDSPSLYGQFVTTTGTLSGSRFPLITPPAAGGMITATWHPGTNEYMVVYMDQEAFSNWGQRVSQTGSLIGTRFDFTAGLGGVGNFEPMVLANTVNNEYLISWFNSYSTVWVRRYSTAITQTSVTINLGNTNIEDYMTHPIGGDGDTVGATGIGGRECRRNMDPGFNDHYFYFTVNDGWAFQGNKPDVWIYVVYYDEGTTGSITLQYDSTSNAYKDGGTILLTGTNTWKTQKWHVTDAYFGNRQNNGGDFRVHVGNVIRYLDGSTVNQLTPSTTPPGAASGPNPANGATGVSATADLIWTAGSGATSHNVYFGTTNPPPFIGVQTTTTYDPGTMAGGTTYYWRIDEYRDGGGTTNGTVWSFTTGGGLPGQATNPNPANSATGVNINADLSWTADGGATSHDVRFGTTNPPPFVINQTATTYDPGTLVPGTTYFWRVDAKNASGTTTGTVWSFTTLPLPGTASGANPANGATGVVTSVTLSWMPGSNATSHNVSFGTNNPPPFVINQTAISYNPGTLANSTTYFWRIDEVNSSGTTTGTVWSFTTAAPLPPCFFDNFVYSDGNLNGNGGWTGSATTQIALLSQTVRITGGAGSADALKTVNCGDPGAGTIRVAISIRKGTGTSNMWSLWIDDASNLNLARWYGTGTIARGRIGATATITADQTLTGGWDRLVALINPTANTSQFFFNGADLGVYDHSVTGAGNTIGRVRFERLDNSSTAGNVIDFDNLVIGADPVPTPPGAASNPSPANGASGVATNATLSWTAGSGATSHDVRFGTANPPPFIQNQAAATYNPGMLATNTTYFWRIDEVNDVSTTTGTVWSFTTVAGDPVTFSNSTFPSNAEGWNIVVWRAGTASNGTMAWISSGGNPGGNMRAAGAGSTNNTDSCQREGGEINKLISTVGYTSIQVQYDARFETDQTTTTCTGTCTASVLEGNCADKLAVYYSTSGTAGPWTLLEAVNASSLTQNVWATRTLNPPAGAANQANFALRFRWQFNRAQDKGRLDNIKVIGTP